MAGAGAGAGARNAKHGRMACGMGTFPNCQFEAPIGRPTCPPILSYSAAQTQNQHMPPASFLTRRFI